MINSILRHLKLVVKGNPLLVFLLLFIVGVVIYYPAFHSNFIADDFGQIVNNPKIRELSSVVSYFFGGTFYIGEDHIALSGMYYRPIMMVFYTMFFAMFGLNAFYFHAAQVFIHIINSFLVYQLFGRLLRHRGVSLVLSLLFLVHPINVEAVSYIADLQDVLVFIFGISAAHFVMRSKRAVLSYVILFFLMLLSFLSKETGVVYIIILYLFVELFGKNRHAPFIQPVITSFVALLAYIGMRCGLAHMCTLPSNAPIAKLPFIDRFLHVPAILFYYLKTFVYPINLAILQQWQIHQITVDTFYNPLVLDLLIVLFVLSVPFVVFGLRKKMGESIMATWFRGQFPLGKVYVFFVMWFFVGVTMHLHIVPLDFTVADRWFYFPIVGLLGMVGCLVVLFRVYTTHIFYLVSLGILVLLGGRTYVRNLDWADHMRLYKHDIKVSPDSGPLQNNYAVELLDRGHIREAKKHFLYALKLQPDNPIYLANMGMLAEQEGKPEEALKYYEKSIDAGKWHRAFQGKADLLIKLGRNEEALVFLNSALRHFPSSVPFKKQLQMLNSGKSNKSH